MQACARQAASHHVNVRRSKPRQSESRRSDALQYLLATRLPRLPRLRPTLISGHARLAHVVFWQRLLLHKRLEQMAEQIKPGEGAPLIYQLRGQMTNVGYRKS